MAFFANVRLFHSIDEEDGGGRRVMLHRLYEVYVILKLLVTTITSLLLYPYAFELPTNAQQPSRLCQTDPLFLQLLEKRRKSIGQEHRDDSSSFPPPSFLVSPELSSFTSCFSLPSLPSSGVSSLSSTLPASGVSS